MKYLLTILFFVFAVSAIAQDNSFVKYFDSKWKPCAKENASFYTEFEKKDTVYKCTSYYLPSNKIYAKSTFRDTIFKNAVGFMTHYYENGVVSDSIYFGDNNNASIVITYDKNGKQIERIPPIQNSPEFPGGLVKWKEFLSENLKVDTLKKRKAPSGTYNVILSFFVTKEGLIEDISAENNPGYGTIEEAIRVLSKSPRWNPATQNGTPVKCRYRQTFTFKVSDK